MYRGANVRPLPTRRHMMALLLGASAASLLVACTQAPASAPPAAKPTAPPAPAAAPNVAPQERDKVSVRADWIPGSTHSAFYIALDKGWYEELGLDVEVGGAQGSGQAAQLVATGNATFGHVDGGALVNAIATGLPIKSVALAGATAPLGYTYAQDVIKTPKDMEGKTYVAVPTSATHQFWPAFAEINGIDTNKVTVVNSDATNVRQLVIGKRGDITDGAVGADEYLITLEGRPSGIFLLGDYGLKLVGHAIVASNESIQQKPDMVRRFLDATLRAYDFVKANQPEALEIFFRRNPDASRPLNENQLKQRVPLFTNPSGAQTEEQWQTTIDLVAKYRKLDRTPSTSEVYTNDFLPRR